MARTMFRQAMIWDGSGTAPYPGDVLVEGNRIRAVARKTGELAGDGAMEIDGSGMTLMPGLVEGHAHLSFGGAQKHRGERRGGVRRDDQNVAALARQHAVDVRDLLVVLALGIGDDELGDVGFVQVDFGLHRCPADHAPGIADAGIGEADAIGPGFLYLAVSIIPPSRCCSQVCPQAPAASSS